MARRVAAVGEEGERGNKTKLAMSEERIGDYIVHPVAAMFPLMTGEEYEKFRDSVQTHGQIEPIIVQGKTLIDGRNRMKVCLELEREPIVREYDGNIPISRFILLANISRRHLTQDQKIGIASKAHRYVTEELAARRKLSGKSTDGAAGGRGKKNLTPKSESGLPDRNARSTAGQIAEAAKTSRYKAELMMRIEDFSEELAEQIVRGELTIRQALNDLPRKPRKPRKFKLESAIKRSVKAIRKWIAICPTTQRKDFVESLKTEVENL